MAGTSLGSHGATEDKERDEVRKNVPDETAISEKTPVQLAVVLLCISGVIGFTWWASGVQSSLNVLLSGQAREIENNNGVRQRIEKLERDSDLFMQVGSPALRAKLEPLERWKEQVQASGTPAVVELTKRVQSLETALTMHKVILGDQK